MINVEYVDEAVYEQETGVCQHHLDDLRRAYPEQAAQHFRLEPDGAAPEAEIADAAHVAADEHSAGELAQDGGNSGAGGPESEQGYKDEV